MNNQLNVCFVREPISISFRVIEMDPELVLGIPFLRTFQPQIDWVGKTIEFSNRGRLVRLSSPSLYHFTSSVQPVSFTGMQVDL